MTEGFQVTEEVQIDDLNKVNDLNPQAQNVKVAIDKASVADSKSGDLKSLKLELRIVEGIPMPDGTMGFINKKLFPGFMDLCIWANPETKVSQWYKDKKHLLGFKAFAKALDFDLSSIKINDEFLQGLIGRELLVNIVHQEETIKDENGNRLKTGEMSERIAGFKKVV